MLCILFMVIEKVMFCKRSYADFLLKFSNSYDVRLEFIDNIFIYNITIKEFPFTFDLFHTELGILYKEKEVLRNAVYSCRTKFILIRRETIRANFSDNHSRYHFVKVFFNKLQFCLFRNTYFFPLGQYFQCILSRAIVSRETVITSLF